MKITEDEIDGVLVMHFDGELDLYHVRELREYFNEKVELGKNRIIADFTKLSYVDSTGIGIMLHAFNQLQEAGGALRFVHIPEGMVRLFRLADLGGKFEMFDSQEAALAAFKK